MKQRLAMWVMKMCGWKVFKKKDFPDKCVICLAPHTSNWDFFYGVVGYAAIGGSGKKFMIKKEWFFFPMNLFFKALGGIPIDRSRSLSVTDQMVEAANSCEHFHLGITPEGTRSANPNWKRGFYYIALKANLPIAIITLDYAKKEGGLADIFYPTGNYEEDIVKIKKYYEGLTGAVPENFVLYADNN